MVRCSTVIEVRPVVRERARQLGPAGRRWLDGLPALVDELAREWSITVGAALPGGSASYVAAARTADGRDAVLKLIVPDPDLGQQVPAMAQARGAGYAELFAYDVERRAMLMEALGPSIDRLGMTPERAIESLCRTLLRAWRVPPWPALTAERAAEKAATLGELVGRLWEELGRPCPERVVARARSYADRRAAAYDPDRCVVVHGDPHPGNALRVPVPRPGAESGYVFVDPDGFLADPAYDLGVVLRDWCAELLAGDAPRLARTYCRLLAAHTGVDEPAIWQWGFLERVSTGLFVARLGEAEAARPYLETAGLIADEDVG
jgi:streptomycin 6-kinase